MGIHLFYMRRDMGELTKAFQDFAKEAVSREEFDTYKLEVTAKILEFQKKLDKKPWLALILGGVFSALLTSLVIYIILDLLRISKVG
jgi:hypothetical protein